MKTNKQKNKTNRQTRRQMTFRVDPESYKWKTWLMADAHSSTEQRMICRMLAAGSYVCRVRFFSMKDRVEKCGDWSEESAEFVIVA